MADNLAGLVRRLEAAVNTMEKIIGSGSPSVEVPSEPQALQSKAPAAVVHPIVSQYESAILSKFSSINESASKIDPQISALVHSI